MNELRDLIYQTIAHHFYDGHDCDDGSGIVISRLGNSFDIAFTEDHGECFAYVVEATFMAVVDFLEKIVELRARLTSIHNATEDELYEMSEP